MSERPVAVLLCDIIESCELIEKLTDRMTFEEFDINIMVKQAVERNIEIIGEACSKLPERVYRNEPLFF
jgi:uncharacterized protein with HEPN domain